MCKPWHRPPPLRMLFQDQFVAFTLEGLKGGVVHDRPTFGAVKQVADLNIQRRRSIWRWRVRPTAPRRPRRTARAGCTAAPSPPVSNPRTSKHLPGRRNQRWQVAYWESPDRRHRQTCRLLSTAISATPDLPYPIAKRPFHARPDCRYHRCRYPKTSASCI